MTLSRKIILLIISTFIALVFILAIVSDLILLNGFKQIELRDSRSSAQYVLNMIYYRLEQLDAPADYYVSQLDTRQAHDGTRVAAVDKLASDYLMRIQRLDLVVLFDSNNHLSFVRFYDCEEDKLCPVDPRVAGDIDRVFRKLIDKGATRAKGIVRVNDLPFLFSIRPLKTGGGSVIVGAFLDRMELERITKVTGTTVKVIGTEDEQTLPQDTRMALHTLDGTLAITSRIEGNSHSAGYFLLPDLLSSPTFLVRVAQPGVLLEQGKMSITYIIVVLFISGFIFCCVMLAFMRNTVLDRLVVLNSTVRDISLNRNIMSRLAVREDGDELEELAVSINTMLDSLVASEQALRESEEHYRILFERAPDSIIILEAEGAEAGKIIAANRASAEQHGYTIDELCSMSVQDLNAPESNVIAPKLFRAILQGEWVTSELWHIRKDGSRFPLEVHAGLIKVKGHSYILGFDRDITKRKLAEEADHMYLERIQLLNAELDRKASDLAAANRELETFNYSVSHDMRGPLTRISGYCQLILDDDGTLEAEATTIYVKRIYESCCWLNEMIDGMLKLAQLSRTELQLMRVDLSVLAEEILRELRLSEPQRQVEVSLAAGVTVVGDKHLLRILMENLLSNAWKYSSHTEVTRIAFGTLPVDGGQAYYIRDNGAGFDMKDADRLFRVFSRLHDEQQYSGSGIGLATVQRIIDRHGGRIWAESEPGSGASFYFTIGSELSQE